MHARTTALVAGLVLLGFSLVATAGVYDDVTAWWHLDRADSGTPGATDVEDQRFWGTAGSYDSTSVHGTPTWTTAVPAQGPGGGPVYGQRGMEFSPTGASPNVTMDGYRVSNLTLTGDATLLFRANWDGIVAGQSWAWIYNNAHTFQGGWLLGLNATGNPAAFRVGSASTSPGWTTTPGTWYDMAVTMESTSPTSADVTFYRWADGGTFQKSSTNSVNWNLSSVGAGTIIGAETTGTGGNAAKAFDGTMENMAVWNRALSEADIHEAFGGSGALWSIGIDNGSFDDMRHEGQVDATYTIGEPWHEMRRAVTTGTTTANVHFTPPDGPDGDTDPDAYFSALPYVFHLNVHGGTGGEINVSLNGKSLGTKATSSGADLFWLVPAGSVIAGANTLSIQNTGSATVSWDWMELGGAWQVGYDDNSHAEFSHEGAAPDDFYVTDPNWQHLERAIIPTDPDINLHFFLSDELAQPQFPGMTYYYTTEILSQGGGTHPFDILLNGVGVRNVLASPNGTVVQVGLPWSLLQAGENVITLSYIDSAGNIVFDYHNLQMLPEPTTMTLLGIGGLALLRRRRRRKR
ncbi:PEP-CTERM sorting domain-containing protein [bacterium]|nr:PEP-CTERM sorting domain-containing protein [bacterium]